MYPAHTIAAPQTDTRVERVVEALCATGCQAVRAAITALEAELPVGGTEHLNAVERAQVLAELRAIMAVYDR